MTGAGAGDLVLTLVIGTGKLGAGQVVDVRIANPRLAQPGVLLCGRSPAVAAALVPRLFSLCGHAQGAAARAALAAAGSPVVAGPDGVDDTRAILAERLLAHAWNALIVWPGMVGQAPLPEKLAALRVAVAALRDRPDGAGAAAVTRLLEQAVLGHDGLPHRADDWVYWAALAARGANGAPGALMRMALDAGGSGEPAPRLLPPRDAAWFARHLSTRPDFGAIPMDAELGAVETGALARLAGDARLPPGPAAARIAAQLLDLAGLPARLVTGAGTTMDSQGDGAGTGCAVVETSRGPLAHWVRVVDGRIADWRITAPTEWNFHPDGALRRALVGLPAGPEQRARTIARSRALVAGLDPCVPCRILVEERDDA
ncbi:MAG: hypothetical protein RLY86_1573 [Pseudomonadota bacterium]|jgi:hypothetical protein